MKKQILITLITLMSVSSAFAVGAADLLKSVETGSCETQDIQKAIAATSDRIIFSDAASDSSSESARYANLTALEISLGLHPISKADGVRAEVFKVAPRSSVAQHMASVAKAEKAAQQGLVGVTAPAKFDLVYKIVDSKRQDIMGRVELFVACRAEKAKSGSIKHTAQLISFEIKAKGAK